MIRTPEDALKLINIIELIRAKELAEAAGATINYGAWSITPESSTHIRKIYKAIAEAFFPTSTVSLSGSRIDIPLNERQSEYMALILRRTIEANNDATALSRSASLSAILSSASNDIGSIQNFVSGASPGNTPEVPRIYVGIEAPLDGIRAGVTGSYDYSGLVSRFIESMATMKRVLETITAAIPDVKAAIANIQEMIRMETRRAQAATLNSMDSIIAALTGEPVTTAAVEGATPDDIAAIIESVSATSPVTTLVPGSVIEANGLRYEVASEEEQRRAQEIAASLFGR